MLFTFNYFLDSNPYLKKMVLFVYVRTYGKYLKHKENKNFLENAKKVLERADIVFKEIEIDYWLDFGTLLGAVRNKAFIKHDLDLDLGLFLSDYSAKHESVFNRHGFKKIRSFTIDNGLYGREESYSYLGVSLDLFYYTKTGNSKAYCHLFKPLEGKSRDSTIRELGGLVPKEFLLVLEAIGKISFLGKTYPIPQPFKEHLSDIYGSSFMVEDPTWETGRYGRPNITTLTDKVGVRKLHQL